MFPTGRPLEADRFFRGWQRLAIVSPAELRSVFNSVSSASIALMNTINAVGSLVPRLLSSGGPVSTASPPTVVRLQHVSFLSVPVAINQRCPPSSSLGASPK